MQFQCKKKLNQSQHFPLVGKFHLPVVTNISANDRKARLVTSIRRPFILVLFGWLNLVYVGAVGVTYVPVDNLRAK